MTSSLSIDTDTQVWAALRTKLGSLNEVQAKVTEATDLVNGLQRQWDESEASFTQQMDEDQIDDDQDDERIGLRDQLLEALDALQEQSEQEKV